MPSPGLSELLIRRQQLLAQGDDVSPEQLCAPCPELLDELKQQISALDSMESFLGVELRIASANAPGPAGVTSTMEARRDDSADGEGREDRDDTAPAGETRVARPRSIAGHEILGELGRGGMGVVYRARQKGLDRQVALKMILAGQHARPEHLARFAAEARAVARLQHPNIVQVHEIGEHEGLPYFALEYVAGGSLASKLDGAPLAPRAAAAIAQTLARAVHAAHEQGIVHRDLKPANILLEPVRERAGTDSASSGIAPPAITDWWTMTPKITDFGLAKQLDVDNSLTESGAIMGTPSYMSPEQASGRLSDVGPLSDVYSLGAILYELLTGRPPFRGATMLETLEQVRSEEPVPPRRLVPRLPRDLETISLACLSKDPARRYRNAAALADDLARFLRGEPIQARPVGAAERAWRWTRRNPAAAAAIAAICLATVVLAVGFVVVLTQKQQLAVAHAELEQSNTRLTSANQELEKANTAEHAARLDADLSFRKAETAVNEYFVKVSQEKLLREPGMHPLRRNLLELALEYYQGFLAQRHDDPAIQRRLGAVYFRVGSINEELGAVSEALAAYERARESLEQNPGDEPLSAELWRDLALTYNNMGRAQLAAGDPRAAMSAHREALAIRERLASEDPKSEDRERELAQSRRNIAGVHVLVGETNLARTFYTQAIESLARLHGLHPDDAVVQSSLVDAYMAFASIQPSIDAIRSYRQAIAIQQQVVAHDPATLRDRELLAELYEQLAIRDQSAPPAEGLALLNQALEIFDELQRQNPTVVSLQDGLAGVCDQMAFLIQQSPNLPGGLPRAKEMCERSQALYEHLLVTNPTNITYLRQQVNVLNMVGLIERDLGNLDDALPTFQKALEIAQQHCHDHPGVVGFEQDVFMTHGNLGRLHARRGNWAEAIHSLDGARLVVERLAERDPTNPRHREAILQVDLDLVSAHFQAGRRSEAMERAKKLRALAAGDAVNLYNAACCFAMLATPSTESGDDSDMKRRELADCIELSIDALNSAIDAGWSDLEHTQRDPDLAAIRQHPRYQATVARLKRD